MRPSTRITLAFALLAGITAGATGLIVIGALAAADPGPSAPAARLGIAGWCVAGAVMVSATAAAVIGRRIGRDLARPWAAATESVQALERGEAERRPDAAEGPGSDLVRTVRRLVAEARAHAATLEAEVADRRQEAEALARLMAAAPHALIVTDDTRDVHFVNDAAVELFGLPAEELRRRPFSYVLDPDKVVEVEISRAGDPASADLRIVPVSWRGRAAYLASLTDTTERKKLLGQLRQAQKMEAVGRMAGGVAHDFNNLLSIINMSRDLLLSDPLAAHPRAQQLLKEIGSAGDRAGSLIAQLLAFTRKSGGVPMTVDVNAIVRELAPLLQRLIGEDVELTSVFDPGLCLVKADPSQLEQVIMNLAVNARDAMPDGGHLTIETHNLDLDQPYVRRHLEVQPGPYVQLMISDTGVGMSDEVKAHLFEPFFTTKPDGKGTGLGLTTVYGIVQQMGGHIGVYSEAGHGTTFRIYLPRRTAGVGSTPSEPPRFEISTGDETILLVEDDASMRQLTRLVLESYGYTVLEAENGVRALDVVKTDSRPIDLVVTDVIMPQMGGRVLMEPMRRARPGIRVLYMSGYTDDTVVRYGGIEMGAPFIQKPFTPASLANKVRAVLDELPL